jgi:hypothetical protein
MMKHGHEHFEEEQLRLASLQSQLPGTTQACSRGGRNGAGYSHQATLSAIILCSVMKRTNSIGLLIAIWALPILLFPSDQAGLNDNHRIASLRIQSDARGDGSSSFRRLKTYYSGCFTPLPLCLMYATPADFFISYDSNYEVSPHWTGWWAWNCIAGIVSIILLTEPKTQRS